MRSVSHTALRRVQKEQSSEETTARAPDGRSKDRKLLHYGCEISTARGSIAKPIWFCDNRGKCIAEQSLVAKLMALRNWQQTRVADPTSSARRATHFCAHGSSAARRRFTMAFAHGASHRLGCAVALFLGLALDGWALPLVCCRFRENFCFRYAREQWDVPLQCHVHHYAGCTPRQ